MAWLTGLFGAGTSWMAMLVIAGVIFASGFGSGWGVNGWRLGTELATAKGEAKTLASMNDNLVGANNRCAVNVADVKTAVKGVVDDARRVNDKAVAAMNMVAGKADQHQRKAEEALIRKPVPQAEWCQALQAEAMAYAAVRRGLRMDMNLKGKP